MKRELGAEVQLQAGGGGVFEVSVNGKNIFSKKKLSRFPNDGEIVALIKG